MLVSICLYLQTQQDFLKKYKEDPLDTISKNHSATSDKLSKHGGRTRVTFSQHSKWQQATGLHRAAELEAPWSMHKEQTNSVPRGSLDETTRLLQAVAGTVLLDFATHCPGRCSRSNSENSGSLQQIDGSMNPTCLERHTKEPAEVNPVVPKKESIKYRKNKAEMAKILKKTSSRVRGMTLDLLHLLEATSTHHEACNKWMHVSSILMQYAEKVSSGHSEFSKSTCAVMSDDSYLGRSLNDA